MGRLSILAGKRQTKSQETAGKPIDVFASDMKVDASHKGSTVFYYPDIMVSCSKDRNNNYVETNPLIIVEVLSPTTEARERIEKLIA